MRLHVDHGRVAAERGVGRFHLVQRPVGYLEEAAAVRIVDRPQGGRRAPAIGRVLGALIPRRAAAGSMISLTRSAAT
jgi:hypothetical protein